MSRPVCHSSGYSSLTIKVKQAPQYKHCSHDPWLTNFQWLLPMIETGTCDCWQALTWYLDILSHPHPPEPISEDRWAENQVK